MKIFHVPCLDDNYAYIIVDESTKEAAAIDPVEPEKVIRKAREIGADLKLVLTTHHHWDHAGGNDKIKALVPGIKVFGGSLDSVKGCTNTVENWDKLTLGSDVDILCLHTPCHTKGHISYFVTSKGEEDPFVFTGDTLFIAGCGKFFEGTAEDMYQSLCVTLGSLPKPTRVFCGHEYTEKNLRFASSVEPDNIKTSQKLQWAQQQSKANQPTVPSTVEEEFETNPFMRVDLQEVQRRISLGAYVCENQMQDWLHDWEAEAFHGGFVRIISVSDGSFVLPGGLVGRCWCWGGQTVLPSRIGRHACGIGERRETDDSISFVLLKHHFPVGRVSLLCSSHSLMMLE